MGPLKYIVWDDIQFLIFPASLQHHKAYPIHNKNLINGAGFCSVRPNPDGEGVIVQAWGKSDSLGVESRELDSKIMTNGLNRY